MKTWAAGLLAGTIALAASAVHAQEQPSPAPGLTEPAAVAGAGSDEKMLSNRELVDRYKALSAQVRLHPFAIHPHKRNYTLFSYFESDFASLAEGVELFDGGLNHVEIKFQISVRVPVYEGVFGTRADLFAAYTSRALWQAFNAENSSPFKDINHEPELFLRWPTPWVLGPFKPREMTFGFNHQSNGQIHTAQRDASGEVVFESLSRSWNRVMLGASFEQEEFFWGLQLWHRLQEEPKASLDAAKGDDNPDLVDYMGHFEWTLARSMWRYSASMRVRNNLDTNDNKGAMQFDISMPLTRKLNATVQLFHGHGETLLEYKSRTTRIGFGVSMRSF